MVLPSREVMQDIRNLIYEVTGFGKDEENFYICEQYCLSHVMHHTYPTVNKNEVKKLIDGYILRFFIHGYFTVADGLDVEVKKFLSSENSFKKNPEFDIQWVLLNLLTSLATNLTAVSKLPKMITPTEEDKPPDEINWSQYLKDGLPNYEHQYSDDDSDSDNLSFYSQDSEVLGDSDKNSAPVESDIERVNSKNETLVVQESASIKTFHASRQHIIDELVKRREEEISCRRDIVLRGNFIGEHGSYVNAAASPDPPQILSEFELIGYILKQFLSGENMFKRKGITNAATCSLTQGTVRNYLALVQPYVNMIAIFKEFSNEVSSFDDVTNGRCEFVGLKKKVVKTDSQFNEGDTNFIGLHNNFKKKQSRQKKSVPNIVKLYSLALTEALHPFENKILQMSEYQNSYTLVGILKELRPSFHDLTALFTVHLSATANWLNEPNWLCSVRILMTLYKAVLHSTSNRMGFLFMNMFLYCFQAYLDITDYWISCLHLNDPHDEYIIYRSKEQGGTDSYRVRPYKEELPRVGLKEMTILDFLVNKMINVGHSIDVLNRLDRSIIKDPKQANIFSHHESLYKTLLRVIKQEIESTAKIFGLTEKRSQDVRTFNGEKSSDVNQDGEFDPENKRRASEQNVESIIVQNSVNITKKENNTTNRICCSDNDFMMKGMALSTFCIKLCENDESLVIEKSIWSLGNIMVTSTKNIISERVLNTCDVAKDIVVKEFQLKVHLRLLRNIFLFNDPHLIQPFMHTLFNEELIWRNCYALTARLKECVENRFKDQAEYLCVTVKETPEKVPKNILEAIDGLTIHYQVCWPLGLIFTPYVMSLYNDIFRHILKLQWAHEAICKLQFNAVTNKKKPEIWKTSRRRLELLRFWCLSSLARLRTYFMAQISTPFDLQLNSYQHLSHIIKAHEDLIKNIHSRCLLNNDFTAGKELIFNVLIPLCNDVYTYWCTEHVIPDSKLSLTEDIFFQSQKQFPLLMARLEQE